MFYKLIRKIKTYFYTPQTGDVYYGNPIFFVTAKPKEYVLHGLKDKFGNTVWDPLLHSVGFKLTIEKDDAKDYYVCKSEVRCRSVNKQVNDRWNGRCQPKRINKTLFKEFIANGLLEKGYP